MIYWELFYVFFRIGLMGFGGGMAMLTLVEHDVMTHGWTTQSEFIDMVAISQMTPGPVGINIATYVGYTASQSVFGSAVATFALVLPSLIIMFTVCYIYDKLSQKYSNNPYYKNILWMLRALVIGLIGTIILSFANSEVFFSTITFGIALGCFLLAQAPFYVSKDSHPWLVRAVTILSNPILLLIFAGIVGYVSFS